MIVERIVWAVKPGRDSDLVGLIQEVGGWLDSPVPYRIYRPISGQGSTIVHEMVFEDFEERQKFRTDLFSRPEWPAARDRWWELLEFGTNTEFLRLVE